MISQRLKECRLRNGYTQNDVAKYLFITRQAIGRWERDDGYPTAAVIVKLSKLYNVSTDYLLGVSKDYNIKQDKVVNKTKSIELNWIYLMLICLFGGAFPIVGLIISLLIIKLNFRNHVHYKCIVITSILMFIFSLFNTICYFVLIINHIGKI